MAFRMLHVSDIHCSESNLARVIEREEYDIIVVSGDVECQSTVNVLEDANAPVLAVTGNLDSRAVESRLEDAGMLIDGRLKRVGNLVFAGVGALNMERDIEYVGKRVGSFDVLVSHYPPLGILDEGFYGAGGVAEVRRLVENSRPRLHLFGHIHEARGTVKMGATVFVNAGPLRNGYYAIVELSGDAVNVSMRRLR